MPDDRSSGSFGSSGYIRFSGIDGSGRVPGLLDKKRSKDQHPQPEKDDKDDKKEFKSSEFVDRSAQIRATLNSLAMLNVADVLKNKSNKVNLPQTKKEDDANKTN